MQKDLKIGLAVGSGLVAVAVLWLATRPSLTPQARIQHLRSTEARQETAAPPEAPPFEGRSPSATDSAASGNPTPESTSESLQGEDLEYRQPATPPAAQRGDQDSQAPLQASMRPEPDNTAIPQQAEPIKAQKFYIVRRGDTLSLISYKYYGNASQWPKIFNANRKTIRDANKLPIGTKLIIPD
jgi:nucleoid-associated protein YgaU